MRQILRFWKESANFPICIWPRLQIQSGLPMRAQGVSFFLAALMQHMRRLSNSQFKYDDELKSARTWELEKCCSMSKFWGSYLCSRQGSTLPFSNWLRQEELREGWDGESCQSCIVCRAFHGASQSLYLNKMDVCLSPTSKFQKVPHPRGQNELLWFSQCFISKSSTFLQWLRRGIFHFIQVESWKREDMPLFGQPRRLWRSSLRPCLAQKEEHIDPLQCLR